MVKNNKGLYVIIAILLVLVMALVGYIVYDKVNNKDELENKNQSIDNDKNDSKDDNKDINTPVSYDNWMDYVISADINEIDVNYCVFMKEENIWKRESVKITKDDLSKIFDEMKKSTLTKDYTGGYGGPCNESLDIKYCSENNDYTLSIMYYSFIDPMNKENDPNVLSYLKNSNYTVENYTDNMDPEKSQHVYEYNYDNKIVDDIINEYIK